MTKWDFSDGTCVKVVTAKGNVTECPKENSRCNVSVKVDKINQLFFTDSEYLGTEFDGTIVIGNADCEVDRQIENCVQSMLSEEECLLTITLNSVPCSFVISIMLLNFFQFPDIHKWSKEEKLDIAKHHKQKGVHLFHAGRFGDSFLRFNKSIKLLICIGIEEKAEVKTLYLHTCNNMAWCHLKEGNIIEALTLCNKILNIDSNNVKALLRRSEAYTRLNDLELAVLDLRQVQKLEPKNGIARERLIGLQHRLQIENIKYTNCIKRMFQ